MKSYGVRPSGSMGMVLAMMMGVTSSAYAQSLSVTNGLELWLKADAISGANEGDEVATWPDASGNKADVSAPESKRPVFRKDFANGKPALAFSGGQGLASSKRFSFKDFTVFVVFLVEGSPTYYERLVDHGFTDGFWIGRDGMKSDSWGGGTPGAKLSPYGNFSRYSPRSPGFMVVSRNGMVQKVAGPRIRRCRERSVRIKPRRIPSPSAMNRGLSNGIFAVK